MFDLRGQDNFFLFRTSHERGAICKVDLVGEGEFRYFGGLGVKMGLIGVGMDEYFWEINDGIVSVMPLNF